MKITLSRDTLEFRFRDLIKNPPLIRLFIQWPFLYVGTFQTEFEEQEFSFHLNLGTYLKITENEQLNFLSFEIRVLGFGFGFALQGTY